MGKKRETKKKYTLHFFYYWRQTLNFIIQLFFVSTNLDIKIDNSIYHTKTKQVLQVLIYNIFYDKKSYICKKLGRKINLNKF